jgi:iron(III) transport system ATP-binding protein
MRVCLRNVTKRFGPVTVLRDISLEVRDRELFFLLGPSGCGKTTLLRLIAGFYQPDEGDLTFGERRMNGVPAHQRNTGMVFQNYALWPHMTVAENVAYGLELRRVTGAEKKRRVDEALDIVQMTPYAARTPNQLSGGQQQRVALARALVIRPDVLLLDEPLSNLDAKLRLEMREEIRRIHAQTRITTIYVTHDQKEALSLAGRMAVLRDGVVEQLGEPRIVYRHPANRFVADFIGETNWLPARVKALQQGQVRVDGGFGEWVGAGRENLAPGMQVWLGFRPEAVRIGSGPENNLVASIEHVSYLGDTEQYILRLPTGGAIKAFEQNPEEIRPLGASLSVHVRAADVLLLAMEPGPAG